MYCLESKRILSRGKGSILTVAHCFYSLVLTSYQAPWTTEHFWLVQVTYSSIMHLISTGPDNAHYVRVLRSSRKSPITDTQHLLFLPLLTGWFSFSSSQLQCHFYREPFLPPTPTRKGVTDMVFLSLDFSAGHSVCTALPDPFLGGWVLHHQGSPSSQFLLGPTEERQRQKLGGREKTEAGRVRYTPFLLGSLFLGVAAPLEAQTVPAWLELTWSPAASFLPPSLCLSLVLETLPPSKLPFH